MKVKVKLNRHFFEQSPLRETTKSYEFRYNCPNCGDRKFHLYFNAEKGLYHCFRCGISGRVDRKGKPEVSKVVAEQKIETEIPPMSNTWSPVVLEFLKKRDLLIATQYGKEGSPDSARWRQTIIFSVYPNGYVGRRVARGEPKYIFSKGTSNAIWFDYSTLVGSRLVFLVEGILDALRLLQVGHPAIALLGTGVGKGKLELLQEICSPKFGIKQVGILLDADADLVAGSLDLILRYVLRGIEVFKLSLPTGDPADWRREELKQWLQSNLRH